MWKTQRITIHISLAGRICCPAVGSVGTTQLPTIRVLQGLLQLYGVASPIIMPFLGHPTGLEIEKEKA